MEVEGKLEQGQQGLSVVGGPGASVSFYIFAAPTKGASGVLPEAWEKRMHQRVRVTGKLRFQSFAPVADVRVRQRAPDFYYMILQQTRIEDAPEH